MTQFIVHLYREMRLSFTGIEADTSEAAAAIAHEKPTGDADDIDDCNGEDLSALVDVAGDEEYEQSRLIDFEAERQRKAAPKLLTALKMAKNLILDMGKIVRSLDGNHEWLEFWTNDGDYLCSDSRYDDVVAAIAQAEAAGLIPAPLGQSPGQSPYSVLLLYPDYAGDYGTQTYYAFVTAANPIEAVSLAQQQAVAAQEGRDIDDPTDFPPLLVTEGHHVSQPLFNQ